MAWNAFHATLRLLAPAHIGWHKRGNLQQTRPYITGRSLWGALTARIARDTGQSYEEIGGRIHEELAWTYFFPSSRAGEVSLWPWAASADEFAWHFLGSYASTAIGCGNSAEDGSLHETEFIAARTRGDEPVYLVGHVFERQGSRLPWRDALKRLQLGGERAYGWGRVGFVAEPEETDEIFGRHRFRNSGNRPVVELGEPSAVLAHVEDSSHPERYRGSIEPLVGRVTDTKTASFGATPSAARICWVPGSVTLRAQSFAIGHYGIWEPVETGA